MTVQFRESQYRAVVVENWKDCKGCDIWRDNGYAPKCPLDLQDKVCKKKKYIFKEIVN